MLSLWACDSTQHLCVAIPFFTQEEVSKMGCPVVAEVGKAQRTHPGLFLRNHPGSSFLLPSAQDTSEGTFQE